MTRWLRTIVVACIGAGLCAGQPALAQGGPPPQRVRLDDVRLERVEQMRQVTGELRASRRSLVAAEEQGRVVDLLVDEGDVVEKGQLLVRLDTSLLERDIERLVAARDASRSTVAERAAQVGQAELDVKRLEDALDAGGVNTNELQDARIELSAAVARREIAEADLASAEALLAWARTRLAKMSVEAPFTGAVVRKETEIGQWLGEGDPLIELVELEVIDAWVDVPERFVGSLGGTMTVTVASIGETRESSDVVVVALGDALARTFPVRARLENADGALKPAMSVTATIPTGAAADATTVHKDALLRDDAGSYVYFDAGGTAAPMRVERRWAVGDRVVVDAPRLAPGMRVVVEGNERIFPGQPLIDIDAPPGGAQGAGGPGAGAGG